MSCQFELFCVCFMMQPEYCGSAEQTRCWEGNSTEESEHVWR
jgi:hypothetical protein